MEPSPMLAVAAGFALLLGSGAWRKLRDAAGFEAILMDYRLLPAPLVRPVARGIPVVEAGLAAAWAIASWRPDVALLAGAATAAVMVGYGAAIAANLGRGRSWIDCGCGGGEQLSWVLVARNAILAVLALVPVAVLAPATPGWADVAVAVPMVAAAAVLYLATGTLLANAAEMRPWAAEMQSWVDEPS